MNERIFELAEQANEYATTRHPVSNIALSVNSEKFVKKFAELIVRECMKESMDEIVDDKEIAEEKDPLIREYLKGNNQGIVDAVVRFRNHFGVEG